MNRAQNAAEAQRLLAQGHSQLDRARQFATQARAARDDATLFFRAAQVHATLANIDAEVERAMEQGHRAVCTHGYNQGDCPASACPFGPGPAGVHPKPGPPRVMS